MRLGVVCRPRKLTSPSLSQKVSAAAAVSQKGVESFRVQLELPVRLKLDLELCAACGKLEDQQDGGLLYYYKLE